MRSRQTHARRALSELLMQSAGVTSRQLPRQTSAFRSVKRTRIFHKPTQAADRNGSTVTLAQRPHPSAFRQRFASGEQFVGTCGAPPARLWRNSPH
jgi:hypothetical protein